MFRFSIFGPATMLFVAGSIAHAAPVTAVAFADGNVLDVKSVVGNGSTVAYLAVNFGNGTSEAFQYDFDGSPSGFTILSDVAAATSLDFQYTAYSFGNFVTQISDGSNSVAFPALYYAPPNADDSTAFETTTSQGITFVSSQVGISDVSVPNGRIVAFGDSYTDAPLLPETAVPEPATLGLIGIATVAMFKRRSR